MNARRILIVFPNWLGDVLFSTPFIRVLKENFPKAYIACMIAPRCGEILEGNPNINGVIVYDEKGLHRGLWGRIEFIRQLKKLDFDTVFLLHRSFTRTLLAYLAGIPRRIGYYRPKRGFLLTDKPKPPALDMHRAKFYLGLLEAAGLKSDGRGCDFFIDKKDRDWADGFLKANNVKPGARTIVFNPGGNWPAKRWPAGNFQILGKKILDEFGADAGILITGSRKDMPLAENIGRGIGRNVLVVCGKATLKQTAALFERADAVISADSGPLHIAVSVGAKVIGLYGPTSTVITGPYMANADRTVVLHKDIIGCRIPCYRQDCPDFGCMHAITPQEVFEALKRFTG